MKISVLIIDDHRLFNDGLCAMLVPEPEIEVVGQVYDSRNAMQAIYEKKPDVVMIDFNMPYINGIDLTKSLISKDPEKKILILSMYSDERYIEIFKKAGAKGYIFKTASTLEVINAIIAAYHGKLHFPKLILKSTHSDDTFLKKLNLSNRELEVINLIKEGLKTKEIAERLNISYYTAETHRKNIKLKVGLSGELNFLKFIYES